MTRSRNNSRTEDLNEPQYSLDSQRISHIQFNVVIEAAKLCYLALSRTYATEIIGTDMRLKENWHHWTTEQSKDFLRAGPEGKTHPSRAKTLSLLDGMSSVLDVGCGT